MTWRGVVYTGAVGLLALCSAGVIALCLWHSPEEVVARLDPLDRAIHAGAWDEADRHARAVEAAWRNQRPFYSIARDVRNRLAVDQALGELLVEVEERRQAEARARIAALRVALRS